VAAANAERLGLALYAQMLCRDWRAPNWAADLGKFDLILANPPYVEEGAELSPSVSGYEPAGALFAGADGLDDYRVLVPQLPDLLAEGGIACLEIGAAQAEAVAGIAEAAGLSVEIARDLGDRPRAAILRLGLGKGREND
jgi:release factor glutamine methyltransferase